MNGATLTAIVVGVLGLLGTAIASLLSRRTSRDTTEVERDKLGLATLESAIRAQAHQLEAATARIDQQEVRIHGLEVEVRECHDGRALDRERYQQELAELRDQIGDSR